MGEYSQYQDISAPDDVLKLAAQRTGLTETESDSWREGLAIILGHRRSAQGAGIRRVRQRDEQRDHHRREHGIPYEIFEVTKDLVASWEKYALIVSHTVPFGNVGEALELAGTPGAADKVVVTF